MGWCRDVTFTVLSPAEGCEPSTLVTAPTYKMHESALYQVSLLPGTVRLHAAWTTRSRRSHSDSPVPGCRVQALGVD